MSVAWDLTEGWTVQQVPSSLPPLFSGDRLVVYGLLKPSENAKQGMNKVRLQGMFGNNEKVEHLITFNTSLPQKACVRDKVTNVSVFLHRLAAKTLIQEKQDDLNEAYNCGVENEEHKTLLISLSKSANVVSKFTSFVAVDSESHQSVSGPLQRQVVPSFNVAYHHSARKCKDKSMFGFGLTGFGTASRPASAQEQKRVKKSKGSKCSNPFRQKKKSFGGRLSKAACALVEAERDEVTKHGQEEGAPALLSVISLQKASGAWDLTDQLVFLCGKSRDSLITGCPAAIVVDKSEGKLLWATALALVLLVGKFGNKKDEWEMVAEKGKKWMKKNLPVNVKYDEMLNFAAAAIGVQI